MEYKRNPDEGVLIEGESKGKTLVEIINESRYIDPFTFTETLASDQYGVLPWKYVTEDSRPSAPILKDMHLEQSAEALLKKHYISLDDLNQLRRRLLNFWVFFLEDAGDPELRFKSQDAASLREETRLYGDLYHFYLDRGPTFGPGGSGITEELKYIELLAGKISIDYQDLGLSDSRYKNVLNALIQIYDSGWEDVSEGTEITRTEHARKVRLGKAEIELLYGK